MAALTARGSTLFLPSSCHPRLLNGDESSTSKIKFHASPPAHTPVQHSRLEAVASSLGHGQLSSFKGSVARLRSASQPTVIRKALRLPSPCRADASFAPAMPSNNEPPLKEYVSRLKGESSPPMSDMVWAAAGAFAAMAGFAFLDHLLAPRGLSMSLGSFAAVCTLLFAAPKSPVSQKWNVLIGHAGCAFIGVAALSLLGPGWTARGAALAASVAFMQFTGSLHPPAAGLALIFIDGPKWHALKWWYVLFPGVLGCLYLFLLQEVVEFFKRNFKF